MTTTVSEPLPEGGQESNASSGQAAAELEAYLSRTGAVLESVVTRSILSTEEAIQRAATLAQARAYNARAGYAYAMAGYAEASEQGEAGAEMAAAWAAVAARGAAANERATQAAGAAIEASQPTAEMAETTTDLATAPTGSNAHPSETTPMSAVGRFREGLSAGVSTGRAEQRRRASQGESNAGRFWEDLSTAAIGRAEQRRRAPQGERPGQRDEEQPDNRGLQGDRDRLEENGLRHETSRSGGRTRSRPRSRPSSRSGRGLRGDGSRSRMATSAERSESDGPLSPTANPDAWPTMQASPEQSTRRSRRPGAPGSQEPGARGPEPGARRPIPGARSPESGARRPVPETRSPVPGAWCPEPGARCPARLEAAAAVEEDGFDELWLLDPDRTSALRSGDGAE
jgi:hypothetical protein